METNGLPHPVILNLQENESDPSKLMSLSSSRPALRTDIPQLVSLVNGAYRGDGSKRGWTTEADLLGGQRVDEGMLEEELEAGHAILVLEDRGNLIACVHLEKRTAHAYLGMLTVRPDLQATGLGKRLLAEAEEWIKTRWGLNCVRLIVLPQRSELIAWYDRRGYRLTGQTFPFPYGNERYGIPLKPDLQLAEMEKDL